MGTGAWGAIASLGIFALCTTFYAGWLTARVAGIEAWRLELRADFLQIQRTLRRVEIQLGIEEE